MDDEVVDVEKFHENLQRKSREDLKRKYNKLKEENKALDSKSSKLRYAQDDLRRKLFNQDQRHNHIARLLGFGDIESLEANVTEKDPWIPGGHAVIKDARARILLLEDELAKHVTASKEAQAILAETDDQLKQKHDQLNEVNGEAARLREERDFARGEAERQAAEARKWRVEVQTTLPEMQTLIRELQKNNLTRAAPGNGMGKENVAARRSEPTPGPLHDVANATSPTAVDTSTALTPSSETQHYKHQLELLQEQYNALLALKQKISQKYREEIVRWKKFKTWLVQDEAQAGKNAKTNTQRRILRRKKVLDAIGPQDDQQGLNINHGSAFVKQDGPAEDPDPDITLFDPTEAAAKLDDGILGKPQAPPSPVPWSPAPSPIRLPPIPAPCSPAPCSPATSPPRHFASPSSKSAPLQESLTQQSIVPPTLQHSQPTAPNLRLPLARKIDSALPLSQESLTQPSSAPSPTPVREPMASLHANVGVKTEPEVIVIDSSPERGSPEVKVSLEKSMAASEGERSAKQQAFNPRIKSSKPNLDTAPRPETPNIPSDLPPERKRPRTAMPISEPPPTRKSNVQPRTVKSDARAIRRTSTVLATDTPPRASTSALVRHHSSPPDSPHVPRMNKGKRKAAEMDEDDGDEDGSGADPFIVGPSCSRVKPAIFQTREDKAVHLKVLGKKPHKEYMAEYMQFKGRGRYSNANAAADKTVNGEFEIDPARNGGVNYQFDDVVRDKAERKRLEAGDCECCRDYYEAVGPLPPRLQAPLWRSPSSSQSQNLSRPCRYKNNADNDDQPSSSSAEAQAKAIEAHKREISRHRHNWAPTNTPPRYWHIGFPDTQAVEDINREANEMHARKFQKVEAEASSKYGRYRTRK